MDKIAVGQKVHLTGDNETWTVERVLSDGLLVINCGRYGTETVSADDITIIKPARSNFCPKCGSYCYGDCEAH